MTDPHSLPADDVVLPGEAGNSGNARRDDFDDYAAIRAVLNMYVEGAIRGDSAVMRGAFHADAVIYGQVDGVFSGGPIQRLFDSVDAGPPAKDLQAETASIRIRETIADADVELRNWNGARYSDMFILVKDGGAWKILTKVYHVH